MSSRPSEIIGLISAVLSIAAALIEVLRSAGGANVGLDLISIFLTSILSFGYVGFLAGLASIGKSISRPALVGACYALITVLMLFVAIVSGLLLQLRIAAYIAAFEPLLLFARWFTEVSIGVALIAARRNLGTPAIWAGAAAILLGSVESISLGVALVYVFRVPFLLLGVWLLHEVHRKAQTSISSPLRT